MMRVLYGLLIGLALGIGYASAQPPTYDLAPGQEVLVRAILPTEVPTSTSLPNTPVPPTATLPVPTLTPTVPVPSPTPLPPTPTTGPVSGWHPSASHAYSFNNVNFSNLHEHGTAPPAWVTGAFSQTRELHSGYKGVYTTMSNGVESYMIQHILSKHSARSHGDHDFQLWIREPGGGPVSFTEGVMFYGSGCVLPFQPKPDCNTFDTGNRPLIFSLNDDECETWYSFFGPVDVGWTICGRIEKFDGVVRAGVDGTFRTVDWSLYDSRLDPLQWTVLSPTLRNHCEPDGFGNCKFFFLARDIDYGTGSNPN